MRRSTSIFAIFILLLTAAPLLACMTDGSAMGQKETACCRVMHGKCDGMENMGCCQTDVRSDEHPQLAASAPTIDLHLSAVDWLEPFAIEAQSAPPAVLRMAEAHSPPGLIISRITVLRI